MVDAVPVDEGVDDQAARGRLRHPYGVGVRGGGRSFDHPAVDVELPWVGPEPDREKQSFPLVLTTTYGNAIRAKIFNDEAWKPALAAAGVVPPREKGARWKASRKDGFHVLRHTYASVLLEAGESIVTLARWLGHSSPTITLDHYAHFMPEASGKGRAAIDALLGTVPEYVPEGLVSSHGSI